MASEEHKMNGLLKRLARTKKGEYSVYEAEDSHRGMMAVRNLMDQKYGKEFYGDGIVGRSCQDDPFLLDAYWTWMRGSHDKKIFLFHDDTPIGWSFYACYMAFNGIDWSYFSGQFCLRGLENAVQKFDKELRRNGKLRQCFDYVQIDTIDRLRAAAHNGSEAERVAAAYSMSVFGGYTDARLAEKLVDDESWRVRMMLASSSDVLDLSIMERLAQDPDWRVRRGLCLCTAAINPWMSNDFSAGQYAVMTRLLEDPEFEVRVAATEMVIHGIPGESRNKAIGKIADMPDEAFRNEAMIRILEEGAAHEGII